MDTNETSLNTVNINAVAAAGTSCPPRPRQRTAGRTSTSFPPSHVGLSNLRRDVGGAVFARDEATNAILDRARGFPYSKTLNAHKSCVNALKFSSGEGRFLASGGDDPRIYLWDFYQEDVNEPSHSLQGSRGNIFSLEFSANNKYLFSGGSSDAVLQYDIATLGSPVEAFNRSTPDHIYRDHIDSIRSITCHPTQDEIFMSASEDGFIYRYDVRHPDKAVANAIATDCEITGIQYNPRLEHLFVTSDGNGNVVLRDTRMVFPAGSRKGNEDFVLRYNTKIARRNRHHLSNPESSSVAFDRDGSKLAVTFLHYHPTIYALSDPDPVAVLTSKTLPDGSQISAAEGGYKNSCTMKNGTFGGPGLGADNMYGAGSDDFRGYIWKIPPLPELQDQRREISHDEWNNVDPSTLAFSETTRSQKVIPIEISTPFCRLTGHSSIVNSIAFHPHFLHVATSGVENKIVLHSPTAASPCTQNLLPTPTQVRQVAEEDILSDEDSPSYMTTLLGMAPAADSSDEESSTLRLFDLILQQEGRVDVFDMRQVYGMPGSDSDSDDDEGITEQDSDEDVQVDPY